ncbi:MAG: MBL fold metallo-hydrolase [Betaproteobacteria bacterium]|nr:MBL fold metallo-hydrolase [Betaproteobacteria bacterium]
MTQPALVPRPAATLILARDTDAGIEVFLLRRTHLAAFAGGNYVFPGGALDPSDHHDHWSGHSESMDDAAASRLLSLEQGGLAYWVAAVRECFEEAGLLLACDERGELLAIGDTSAASDFASLRAQLLAGSLSFAELCEARNLRLALDRVAYFSHWITGQGRPRRFDARFFVAVAPPLQTGSHDANETVDHVWIRPAEALERHRGGTLTLMFPTIKTLEALAKFDATEALMQHARTPRAIAPTMPRPATGRAERRMLIPGDYAYAEVSRLDPEGRGGASYEILPGVMTRLSDQVRRLTAPNPGFMTGPGTNSYLLGAGDEIAVIDPGPANDEHIERLLEDAKGAGGRGSIRWILVTHTHMDHSPAAALLRERTGAELLGMPPPARENQDQSFRPDRVLAHGGRITVAGCTLRVIHTPGHASNQVCYLLENEKLLFTGDHIMQGSTVVINPPDGDMAVYLASLRLLQHEDLEWLAPGHGFLMNKPQEMVERLLIHRMDRENKVRAALNRLGGGTLEELVPVAYDDVPARVHPVASRSLLAHLIKLHAEGRVARQGEHWAAVAG